jgi:peptidoglycan/LPS O-acetylase OafA/YrhL
LTKITGIEYGAFTNLFRLASQSINILFFIGALSYLAMKLLLVNSHREVIAKISITIGIALFIIACVLWLNSGLGYVHWSSFNFIFGVAAFFLMIGTASETIEIWASNRFFLLLLGNASYSIYLIHYAVQKWINSTMNET